MNIAETEEPLRLIAKICGSKEKEKKVTYSFVHNYHTLCIDKKDIMLTQLEACERILKQTRDDIERKTIQGEVAELKMALDFMP